MESLNLPTPPPEARQTSEALSADIRREIAAAGGTIPFSRFMHRCLYSPGIGYYSGPLSKLGAEGDFITAPEISPLFGQALAMHIADTLRQLSQGNVLEFGAGNGTLAVTILQTLADQHCLPARYLILETSADLRTRQYQTLQKHCPDLLDRVIWLDSLPVSFAGAVIANEVCDAMPFDVLCYRDEGVFNRHVRASPEFEWVDCPITDKNLRDRAENHQQYIDAPYFTEVSLQAEAWLNSVASSLQAGSIFLIDYGYGRPELLQADRASGSLLCHYRHQAHRNPFWYPGLQDITADVDFTALAEVAFNAGLQVDGFHYQRDFLLAGDIERFMQTGSVTPEQGAALKQLLMPTHMGEKFKVLSLSCDIKLPRLAFNDRREQL